MNIITTGNYVAGIFATWQDAQAYIALKPAMIQGFQHTNSALVYPFFLLELDDRVPQTVLSSPFIGFQTETEARHHDGGIILYTITEDYQPAIPWMDSMGGLEHEHLTDMDHC